jgi:hypothetical protein
VLRQLPCEMRLAAADAPSGPGVCVCLSRMLSCCCHLVCSSIWPGCGYLSGAVLGLYRTAISQLMVVAVCRDPLSLHSMGLSQSQSISGTAQKRMIRTCTDAP